MTRKLAIAVGLAAALAVSLATAQQGSGPGPGPGMGPGCAAQGTGTCLGGYGPGGGPGPGYGPGYGRGGHGPKGGQGMALLTPDEQTQFHDAMHTVKTLDQCNALVAQHRQLLEQRAAEKGVAAPPGPRGNPCERMRARGFID